MCDTGVCGDTLTLTSRFAKAVAPKALPPLGVEEGAAEVGGALPAVDGDKLADYKVAHAEEHMRLAARGGRLLLLRSEIVAAVEDGTDGLEHLS